jgi:hypothetical protein
MTYTDAKIADIIHLGAARSGKSSDTSPNFLVTVASLKSLMADGQRQHRRR